MSYFKYSKKHTDFLANSDAVLGRFIKSAGRIRREVFPDLFRALAASILAQQISSKAASSIYERLEKTAGTLEAKSVLKLDAQTLKNCGMSMRKAEYILGAAKFFSQNPDAEKSLAKADDAAFCSVLTSLNGVGLWTAQMMLIFSLNRMNVLSGADFGIRSGMKALYGREIDADFIEKKRIQWSPYCSVASIYLWEAAARAKAKSL